MRLQYEISKEKNAELEKLMKDTGIDTKREFINAAVTLFMWAINEAKNGRSIGSVDEESSKWKEIVMSALETVKKRVAV